MRRTAALALAAALAAAALAQSVAAEAPGRRRFMLETPQGEVVTDADFGGRWLLLSFGYTLCPDICPTNLAVIAEALDLIGDRADHVTPLFVTVDPQRDTPEVLAAFVAAFDPRFVALTGPKPYIDHVVKAYNAFYEFHPTGEGEYSVDHTASTAFVGPDGLLIGRFGHGLAPERIAAEIAAAIDAAEAAR